MRSTTASKFRSISDRDGFDDACNGHGWNDPLDLESILVFRFRESRSDLFAIALCTLGNLSTRPSFSTNWSAPLAGEVSIPFLKI